MAADTVMTQTLQRVEEAAGLMRRMSAVLVLGLVVCLFTLCAQSQTSSGGTTVTGDAQSARIGSEEKIESEKIAKLEQDVADAKSSGDNAWMLMSSALVLMMTGPGLDRKSTRLNSSH